MPRVNDYLPKSELEPDRDPKRPSNMRLGIWIVVGAIGLYLVGSGIWGIVTAG
ncbi:hypothetical protein [Agromyces subbeticus]|uniref:hypothetical protein n=1 Tax=Agromyces subbeticus TaxID=293890 RepID=UPI0003B52F86|nr:hypothetical protein [Agromyces subbeticus]